MVARRRSRYAGASRRELSRAPGFRASDTRRIRIGRFPRRYEDAGMGAWATLRSILPLGGILNHWPMRSERHKCGHPPLGCVLFFLSVLFRSLWGSRAPSGRQMRSSSMEPRQSQCARSWSAPHSLMSRPALHSSTLVDSELLRVAGGGLAIRGARIGSAPWPSRHLPHLASRRSFSRGHGTG